MNVPARQFPAINSATRLERWHGFKSANVCLLAACTATTAQAASAQVVRDQPIGTTIVEPDAIVSGWSIKRSILRKPVFNEDGEKVGTAYDIVVAPDKSVSYAIIDAQGFIGIPRHDVAVPVDRLDFKLPAIPNPRDAYQH